MRLWAEQIHNICRALPECRDMGARFADLVDDSVSDLYVTLRDVVGRYCELCFRSSEPRSASPDPEALTRYLFNHPDRCTETLAALDCWERDHRFWAGLCT